MVINSIMRNGYDVAVLALTAQERWAASRKVSPRSNGEYLVVLAIALLLAALVLLLWWISYRRHSKPRAQAQDLFSDGATRKSLGLRERQVLLAVVARSGIRRNHDIFTTPDAFDRGAAKLLQECTRRRTPEESERLRAELADLRTKLAYRVATGGQQAGSTSSRDIPVDMAVEVSRTNPEGPLIPGVVVSNDGPGIAVETQEPAGGAPGESWQIRYHHDGRTWELATSCVSCADRKLVLDHGAPVRASGLARREDLAVHAPAIVARFPFIQTATPSGDAPPTDWFEFVRGAVTHVSDTNLQIRCPLSVSVGERVLVMFTLTPGGADDGLGDAHQQGHIVGHVGRVTRCHAAGQETVMIVDLTDLAGREIGELMRLAQAAISGAGAPVGTRVTQGA